ncbi:L,D-transpeptidase family protein [Wenxinia saemankumensis]|uniref:L,D-transpeptidase catalytic domain n=1 Tax=Wenxinia saemankumensis TaxID=1447782 RepID=A0A1M6FUV0_9RHOB|nr:L,D-transpeptidase family protein [Wenxinia saemankumensis]SHJ01409.1 L,D-transpeptidase catalytic domain [Wenxinia saemankumensis]
MIVDRRTLLLGGAAALAGCAAPSKFLTYDGPQVTSALVLKGQRTLLLMNGQTVLKQMRFELGFNPTGHKQFKGDGRTPEGGYVIDRRNPNSAYHLSIGISYPNDRDRAFAREMGRDPGGDIFIHGTPEAYVGKADWTAGCVAVDNSEMEECYAMVQDGTPVFLYA